jgi:hypothetical protein
LKNGETAGKDWIKNIYVIEGMGAKVYTST